MCPVLQIQEKCTGESKKMGLFFFFFKKKSYAIECCHDLNKTCCINEFCANTGIDAEMASKGSRLLFLTRFLPQAPVTTSEMLVLACMLHQEAF
jgi:hypothetical protein